MVDLSFPALTGFLVFLKDLLYIIYSFILVGIFIALQYGFYRFYKLLFTGLMKAWVKAKEFMQGDSNFINKFADE